MSEINDCVNCSLIQMHINLKYMGLLFNDDDTYNNTYIEKYGFNWDEYAKGSRLGSSFWQR